MILARDLYDELVEFLENQQDADCLGDPPQYVPNKAMSLLMRLKKAGEEYKPEEEWPL